MVTINPTYRVNNSKKGRTGRVLEQQLKDGKVLVTRKERGLVDQRPPLRVLLGEVKACGHSSAIANYHTASRTAFKDGANGVDVGFVDGDPRVLIRQGIARYEARRGLCAR